MDCASHLAWERLRIPQVQLESGAGERDIWKTLLSLLPPKLILDKQKKTKKHNKSACELLLYTGIESLLLLCVTHFAALNGLCWPLIRLDQAT